MRERSELISKLIDSLDYRTSYIKAKLGILVPSQIRALRLQSEMPRQVDLAKASEMQQSRISAIETPGESNLTLETLARLGAAFKVGVIVQFVPFSDMLTWENSYSQSTFNVTPLEKDHKFLDPEASEERHQLNTLDDGYGSSPELGKLLDIRKPPKRIDLDGIGQHDNQLQEERQLEHAGR